MFFFFIPATIVITSIFAAVTITAVAAQLHPSDLILTFLPGASDCSGPLVSFSLCLERAFSF